MRMIAAATVLALSSGAVAAQEPPPRFRAPQLVVAIVYNEFRELHARDPLTLAIRARYFDGFAAILDRSCRFLPAAANEAVRSRLDEVAAQTTGDSGVIASAAASGIADGRAFADRFGCSHSKTDRAQLHLAGFFGTEVERPGAPALPTARRTTPRPE